MIFIGIGGGTVWLQNCKYGESLTLTVFSLTHKFKEPCVSDSLKNFLNGNAEQNYGGRVVYVSEQTDQFQKFGKNLARKYEFKKVKKFDLNQKKIDSVCCLKPESRLASNCSQESWCVRQVPDPWCPSSRPRFVPDSTATRAPCAPWHLLCRPRPADESAPAVSHAVSCSHAPNCPVYLTQTGTQSMIHWKTVVRFCCLPNVHNYSDVDLPKYNIHTVQLAMALYSALKKAFHFLQQTYMNTMIQKTIHTVCLW